MTAIRGPGPRMEWPLSLFPTRIDAETENLRECLRILGPALDEGGFVLRRHIVAAISLRALAPFESENLLVNPEDGDLADEEKRRMAEAMRHAIGSDEFRPVVSFDYRTHKLNIDILPHEFPGTPLEQWYQDDLKRKRKTDAEAKAAEPSVALEGQNR